MKLFFPWQIERMTNKEIRREYSKLRSTANKRLRRLQDAGLGGRGDFRFPKLEDIKDSNVHSKLADVSRFLRDERTTVKGEKKFIEHEIEMLHEKKYYFIDRSNIYDFIDFMEERRNEVAGMKYDSTDDVDVYNEAQRLNIPTKVLKKNFDFFRDNISAMEDVEPIKTEKRITFSMIKRKMQRWMK